MKGVKLGDRIQLSRILEVGSRDFTLRATSLPTSSTSNSVSSGTGRGGEGVIPRDWQRHPDSLPYLSSSLVRGYLTVIEHTKGEMFEVTKFKRRKGYRRLLRSKLGFTRLRVGDIELGEHKVTGGESLE